MHTLQNNPLTSRDSGTRTHVATAAVFASLLTVACGGGPRAALHDLVDEAALSVAATLTELQALEGEIREITERELEPCMERYRSRPMSQPGYVDVVPRPEELEIVISPLGGRPRMRLESRHRRVCDTAQGDLRAIGSSYHDAVGALATFEAYADALHDAIDRETNDARAARIESLSRSIGALGATRPDEDTLLRRYRMLESALLPRPLGPELMALANDDPVLALAVTTLAIEEYSVPAFRQRWTTVLENYDAAKRYTELAHAYMRQIYEGPDAAPEP